MHLTILTQGTHVITWSFDDGNGNISTATQNVVIDDVTAPVVPVGQCNRECTATATAPTTTDNCSGTITGTTTDALLIPPRAPMLFTGALMMATVIFQRLHKMW